jgi:outer membrane receptor protein involved in Fe transport
LAAVAGVRYSNIQSGATVALFDPDDPEAPPVDTPIQPRFNDWTASVGLTYEVTPCLHLVGSVAEGFRAPSLDDLTSVSDNVNEGIDIPNPALSPETSINYEAGLKFNYDRLRAQTFVFWTELNDLLDRQKVGEVPDPLVPGSFIDILQRRNLGTAQLQGYELAGELLLTPTWSLFGNFTYIYGQNLTADEPMSRIPPAQGILGLRWRDRKAQNWFDLYGWLVARQDRLSARDIRDSRIPDGGTPGYGTVNLRLGRRLAQNHRITLGIENIFDALYRVHGSGVDGPGISGVFGYELHL